MRSFRNTQNIFLSILLYCFTVHPVQADRAHIMGYYYFDTASDGFMPQDIHIALLTHAIYAFIDIAADGTCQLITSKGDVALTRKSFEEFHILKKRNSRLKTMFSIGGASNSATISDALSTSEGRARFAQSCVTLMKENQFDGIDIDWEFPVVGTSKSPGKRPEDMQNLVSLVTLLRKQMPQGALLSAAVPAEPKFRNVFDVGGLARHLNWFGVMVYDFCMSNDNVACHHSLYPDLGDKVSGEQAIGWYLQHGARRDQIMLGVPFYGYMWKVHSLDNNGIWQETGQSGYKPYETAFDYKQIKNKFFGDSAFQYVWDAKAREPLLINSTTKQILSFDDECSLALKALFAARQKFSGVFAWELAADDAQATLLSALNGGLRGQFPARCR